MTNVKNIKSSKSAVEVFQISEEQGDDVDELRETFKDIRDLRAVLEDYFHIYDDYAEMTPEEFDTRFAEYVEENDIQEIDSDELEDE